MAKKLDIDLVYLWCDSNDAAWDKKRREYMARARGAAASSKAGYRFESNDELKYSLRSVEAYMPWVRRIYIIADGQRPSWLAANNKVRIIEHSEIIDKKYLPLFNPLAIELNIYKIPGLAERFIYMNDDFLIGRKLKPEYFFDKKGRALNLARYLSPSALSRRGWRLQMTADRLWLDDSSRLDSYLRSQQHCRRMIFEEYGACPSEICCNFKHTPRAFLKSECIAVARKFAPAFDITAKHRFREEGDILWAIYIYAMAMRGTGRILPLGRFDELYVEGRRGFFHLLYSRLRLALAPWRFICVNDFTSATKHWLGGFFARYSQKSVFEI